MGYTVLITALLAAWLCYLYRSIRGTHWPTIAERDRMRLDEEKRIP